MQRQDDTSLRGADSRNGKGAVRYLFLMRCWNCMQRACQWYKISENDLRKQQVSGFYRDVELGEPPLKEDEINDLKSKFF